MKVTQKIEILAMAAMILWFTSAMYLQHNVGLADNGDFTRSMRWISSGPIGIEPNWPADGTDDWSKRFFNYWIPSWKLQWKMCQPTSSAILLWLPGALLNDFFYSSKILYLPALSLFPKLILFAVLLLLFWWIGLQRRFKMIFLISLGLPVTLLFTTTDYTAYLNSYYQESGSFVFLFLVFLTIVLLNRRPSIAYLLCGLASVLLLATAKTSNVYWPLVAVPFILGIWHVKKNIRLPVAIAVGYVLILIFTVASESMSDTACMQANAYNSLFYGALTFSNNPSAHLRRLGISDAARYVNTSAHSSKAKEYSESHNEEMSLKNTIMVFCREPAVMFRMLKHVLDNMQDVSLDYLGQYSFNDPRAQPRPPHQKGIEERFRASGTEATALTLWAVLKFRFFPRGYALLCVLVTFAVWFKFALKRTGFCQDLAIVGLISTIACAADMVVAIVGDGKYELIKHLFLANVLFDVAAITFLNSILAIGFETVGEKLLRRSSQE